MEKKPHSQRETQLSFWNQEIPPFLSCHKIQVSLYIFSQRVVTFKSTLKSYFYFLGLPSSIGDDLNFELKHSQHPRLKQKTTAKKHQAVKRGKIIGGKITVKSSLDKRRSQMLQKQKLKWCYPEPGDTKWLHLQPWQRTGGQDVNRSKRPQFWEYPTALSISLHTQRCAPRAKNVTDAKIQEPPITKIKNPTKT